MKARGEMARYSTVRRAICGPNRSIVRPYRRHRPAAKSAVERIAPSQTMSKNGRIPRSPERSVGVQREEGRRVAVHEHGVVAVLGDLPVPDAVPAAEITEERRERDPGSRRVARDPALHGEQPERHRPAKGRRPGAGSGSATRTAAARGAAGAVGAGRVSTAGGVATWGRAVVLSRASGRGRGSGYRLPRNDREDVAEIHAHLAVGDPGAATTAPAATRWAVRL